MQVQSNRENKEFLHYACNLCLMETNLNSRNRQTATAKGEKLFFIAVKFGGKNFVSPP